MTDMNALRNIVNGDAVDATDVEWNFNTIETFLATSMVNIDGTNVMIAPLTLQAGDPTNATDAASKQYVDKTIAPGAMMDYAGQSLTAEMDAAQGGQWLICNGAIITDATYPDLAIVLNSAFDTETPPAGQTYLPDFRRRVAIGYDALTPPFDTFGEQGGLPGNELISHTHVQDTHNHIQNSHGHGDNISANQAQHNHTADGTLTAALAGDHDHPDGVGGAFVMAGTGGSPDNHPTNGGGGTVYDYSHAQTTGEDGAHTHDITGATGQADPAIAISGGVTDATAVNVTKIATNQFSGSASVDADAGNYPPYVIVTKIIHI